MIDFIKNNKIIVGVVSLILVLLLVIIAVILSLRKSEPVPTEEPVFGDTDGTRVLSEEELLFGTSSERWIATEGTGEQAPNLRAITQTPVIGAMVYERGIEGSLEQYVRFTSRTNGYIYDTPLATIGAEEKISNETIIRIGVSSFAQNAETFFTQYLDKTGEKIQTYLRSFAQSTTTPASLDGGSATTTKGRHLNENITSASLSPKGDMIFYLVKTDAGSVGYLENVATSKKTQVWSSILSNLTVSWGATDVILIYPNPSSQTEGLLWALQPSTGKTRIILGNEIALAAKSNSLGTKILFSKQEKGTGVFSLRVLDIGTGKVSQLSMATMVDKCAWGTGDSKYVYCAIPRTTVAESFLEDWYMSKKASDDVLWRIDTEIGITKMLLDPKEDAEESFDIIDLVVSPQEDYIVFRTKQSSVLWSLRLPAKENRNPTQATTTPQIEVGS